MLTYELKKKKGLPLYEALYRCIREDIVSGVLAPGEKLPSKRSLSQHLEVSKITVETAYDQLLSEGYIRSKEKVGYFVESIYSKPSVKAPQQPAPVKAGKAGVEHFPFSVWSKLQRQVVLDYGKQLLLPLPNQGLWELRVAISQHLAAFRGMQVDPAHIIVGAGTDFLYNILIQLLGRDMIYGAEDPGYGKIRKIYLSGGVGCTMVELDEKGVRIDGLQDVQVLHISPNHHFPTGLVTPLERRRELVQWVREENRWIIEDDYDSEFRFDAAPMRALQSACPDRVIYMNSFTKSLAPSFRISYMVLPPALMEKFHRELGFYSCTVGSFEQYTLERFLSQGHFEKHINRMRKFYRSRRKRMVQLVQNLCAGRITTLEQDAGLHFLLKVETDLSDQALKARLQEAGIQFAPLSEFYHREVGDLHCLVVNYAALPEEELERALKLLLDMEQ